MFGSTVSVHFEDDNTADLRRERKAYPESYVFETLLFFLTERTNDDRVEAEVGSSDVGDGFSWSRT